MLIPLCVFRISTYLFISVCCIGSAQDCQQGENVKIIPGDTNYISAPAVSLSKMMFFIISCTFLPISAQSHSAGSNMNPQAQDRHPRSSTRGRTGRRRHHHHRQSFPAEQPSNTAQQLLHPGNLLRRLLPSSSLFNSGSHASWAPAYCKAVVRAKTSRTLVEPHALVRHLRRKEKDCRKKCSVCCMERGPAGGKLAWQLANESMKKHRRIGCCCYHPRAKLRTCRSGQPCSS